MGTLIKSVSGSGQVLALNQVDLKSKAAGEVIYVGMAAGREVKEGDVLVRISDKEAQKTIRDAQISLESARLSLEKLKEPVDALSLLQQENSLAQARESKQKAQDDLGRAYEDGFNQVANAFLDLPTVMTGLNDLLYDANSVVLQSNINYLNYYCDAAKNFNGKADLYRADAAKNYQAAREEYDKNFQNYKSMTRSSDRAAVESLISETYDTAKAAAESVKSANNLIQLYKDELTKRNLTPQPFADTHLTSLNGYTTKTNSLLTSLLSVKNAIQTDKEAIIGADRTIREREESLAKLKAGTDARDIRAQELAISQKVNALADAREKLADYTIAAPFDGVVASVSVKEGDTLSSGGTVATVITEQKIAEVSLNEVDTAKVETGQKATITFDAVDGLSLTGTVTEVDTIGTASQGVVTYNAQIAFDAQDERVKPGMSVSASIIAESRQNVLLVPNTAVKSQGDGSYVEVIDRQSEATGGGSASGAQETPRQVAVEVGLANDDYTEITGGLSAGDEVVVRTVNSSASAQKNGSSQRSGGPDTFRMPVIMH